jgi:GTPase SAR1 family protein
MIESIEFEVHDVGGQRSERKKWVNSFPNVNAVIFVAALSEYDQTLAEAKRHNRMMEALNLFESVVKNVHFENTPIMLFLNKKDIFAEKIMYSNITDSPFFSDYAGPPNDFDHGVLYFIQKFEEHMEEDINDSFIHVTCATDTNNMEFVLDSSRIIIMNEVSLYLHHCLYPFFLYPLFFVLLEFDSHDTFTRVAPLKQNLRRAGFLGAD